MPRLRQYIERHFGMVLLLSALSGLIVPGLDQLPNRSAIATLALLMFISCYKLRDGGLGALRWRNISLFYVLRYGLLPWVLWMIAHAVIPGYATGVFLLSVLPAGVSSPAIGSIYGGTIAPGFAIVILSQLATPFLIPLQFSGLAHFEDAASAQVMPPPADLFMTMVWCILVPMLAYAGLKKHQRLSAYIHRQNSFFSILLVAFVIALAVAKQREVILSHGFELAGVLSATFLCFASYMLFGWAITFRQAYADRITYAACSSFNNAALGVSLALLHFSPPVILFVAVSEVSWSLLPFLFRFFLRTRTGP